MQNTLRNANTHWRHKIFTCKRKDGLSSGRRPETREILFPKGRRVLMTRQLPKLEVLKGKVQEIFWGWILNGHTHTHTHEGKKKKMLTVRGNAYVNYLIVMNSYCISKYQVVTLNIYSLGASWWFGGKESTYQCRRCWFDPWLGKTSYVKEQLSLCTTTTEPVL